MKVIRGAICAQNTISDISDSAVQLVGKIMTENKLSPDKVSAVFFSVTEDLDACYPATAVRRELLPDAAFMCFQEMKTVCSLKHCIRVTIFAETDVVRHCYIGEAACLRPDLKTQ